MSDVVTYSNNGSAALQAPDIQLGFGNVTSRITVFNVTGAGYSVSQGTRAGQSVFTITGGGQTIPAGGRSSFTFEALVPDAVTRLNATRLHVLLVSQPFVSLELSELKLAVVMPNGAQLAQSPKCTCASGNLYKLPATVSNFNYTYSRQIVFKTSNSTQEQAITQEIVVKNSGRMDLHPLDVYSASRVIAASANGDPVVQDSLTFANLGTTDLYNLTVAPLTTPGSQVTVLPSAQPRLLSPVSVTLIHYAISLNDTSIGFPVEPGQNYTISYSYPLASQYYKTTGGEVQATLPQSPPIQAFVDSYTISTSLQPGIRVVQAAPQTQSGVSPFVSGQVQISYGLSIGWALDGGVPVASLLFVVSLVGLFVIGQGEAEEETAEETTTDRASAMIKAFEEKTSLINGIFDEITSADPNQLNKAYFDELRSRLDVFRSRALQRLNELKQKSTTKKFFDLLNQMHETEREVDRAARDMLNLYEQYYLKRTRKEVFDRLLPNYRRRLDRALNQLSDELNTAQREAKLL